MMSNIKVARKLGWFAHARFAQFEGYPRLLQLVLAALLVNSWRIQCE
jgi:hypothetical protein